MILNNATLETKGDHSGGVLAQVNSNAALNNVKIIAEGRNVSLLESVDKSKNKSK
ncbi:hypothetical protein IHC92_17255 [Photobacterium damselae subsp. damselae]|uniref:hypothetical protein n=1 Tax=Photobacterium damselae TaxID=38293 RepID=UPI001F20AC1B|nr:hypothetical protein [Photobacterium damselae]UKA23910.1 hypothetical protein IHC92_17255 [Photobacterium damselae subsp. damselae]